MVREGRRCLRGQRSSLETSGPDASEMHKLRIPRAGHICACPPMYSSTTGCVVAQPTWKYVVTSTGKQRQKDYMVYWECPLVRNLFPEHRPEQDPRVWLFHGNNKLALGSVSLAIGSAGRMVRVIRRLFLQGKYLPFTRTTMHMFLFRLLLGPCKVCVASYSMALFSCRSFSMDCGEKPGMVLRSAFV